MRMENNSSISMGLMVDIIKKLSLIPRDDYIDFLCNNFGMYIMKERIKLGMTQKELASILKVARKTIRSWEKEYSMPSYENYLKITQALVFETWECLKPSLIFLNIKR